MIQCGCECVEWGFVKSLVVHGQALSFYSRESLFESLIILREFPNGLINLREFPNGRIHFIRQILYFVKDGLHVP